MRKTLLGSLLLLLCVLTGYAQDAVLVESIVTLSLDNAGSLAFTSDGRRLLVGDEDGQRVRAYTVTDMLSAQERAVNYEMYGTPVALTATRDIGIAVLRTDDGAFQAQFFELRSRGGDTLANLVDLPSNAASIALSPNQTWGVIAGGSGYVVMELLSPYNINSYIFDTPVLDAALTNDHALLVREGASEIEVLMLNPENPPQSETTLSFDSSVQAVALNADASVGAAALSNGQIALFDPQGLNVTNTFESGGGTVVDLAFITSGNSLWLAVARANEQSIDVMDVTDSGSVVELGQIILDSTLRSMAVFNDFIATTDGSIVTLIEAAQVPS